MWLLSIFLGSSSSNTCLCLGPSLSSLSQSASFFPLFRATGSRHGSFVPQCGVQRGTLNAQATECTTWLVLPRTSSMSRRWTYRSTHSHSIISGVQSRHMTTRYKYIQRQRTVRISSVGLAQLLCTTWMATGTITAIYTTGGYVRDT